jgi:hypothetical protein
VVALDVGWSEPTATVWLEMPRFRPSALATVATATLHRLDREPSCDEGVGVFRTRLGDVTRILDGGGIPGRPATFCGICAGCEPLPQRSTDGGMGFYRCRGLTTTFRILRARTQPSALPRPAAVVNRPHPSHDPSPGACRGDGWLPRSRPGKIARRLVRLIHGRANLARMTLLGMFA